MADIEFGGLVINNDSDTLILRDRNAVSFAEAQALTAAQKTQARENIGADFETDIGDLIDLETTEKSNVVGAINEVNDKIVDIHNYRTRRNITSDLTNLSTAVAEQNLKKYGYDIGDYFNGASGYQYILADLDTFYGGYNSYSVLNTHHISIVVNTKQSVQWNTSNTTATGYAGSNYHSYMVNTVLPNVKSDFRTLFGGSTGLEHLLSHQKLYSASVDNWAWSLDQYISALTSVQLHGSPVCDMNFHHTGEGNKPLEVFQKYFYPEILGNQNNWERSVASASCPCRALSDGYVTGTTDASNSGRAVGLILFH